MKQQVIEAVRQIIAERMDTAQRAMQAAQESANAETKSSAGDKYETGRAMSQRDRDMYAQQYETARREMASVERLADLPNNPAIVVPGALVKTTNDLFWIAVSIGKITVNEQTVMVISAQAPVGKILMGRKTGDTVTLPNGPSTIETIY
jgi:transcription elongation GreA/GreB family factor